MKENHKIYMSSRSLTATLASLGYSHQSVGGSAGKRRIYDAGNAVVFIGNASQVWEWLKSTGQISPKELDS